MKIKKGFILKKVADSYVVVAVGQAVRNFNGAITLNEVSATMWNMLETGATVDELALGLTKEFEVEYERAKADAEQFVKGLKEANLVE